MSFVILTNDQYNAFQDVEIVCFPIKYMKRPLILCANSKYPLKVLYVKLINIEYANCQARKNRLKIEPKVFSTLLTKIFFLNIRTNRCRSYASISTSKMTVKKDTNQSAIYLSCVSKLMSIR